MPLGLTRLQDEGDDHLITVSCSNRRPYLQTPATRDLFERSLERTRNNYSFHLLAYVVMPEHLHLLVSEPDTTRLSKAMQALKVSVSKQFLTAPFQRHNRYCLANPERHSFSRAASS